MRRMNTSRVKRLFQHTATRRRLHGLDVSAVVVYGVSTHSRPKAAATAHCLGRNGGMEFQHTAARRRLPPNIFLGLAYAVVFQHTAARRRLLPT